jgi:hemolysin activation/secretion protein
MDGQWAQKNLDATQKFSLGGLRNVRAYEAGALSADTGVFSSVELRVLLPPPDETWNIQGQWYASVFWDKAVARVNQNPWTDKTNDAYLRGTGLALYWQGPNEWRATVSVGKSLGSVPSLLSSSDAIHKTAWLELAKAWR